MAPVVPPALGESNLMCINIDVITYLEVYQAALTRCSTPKHACLKTVLFICEIL
jgi:hypothetical protein